MEQELYDRIGFIENGRGFFWGRRIKLNLIRAGTQDGDSLDDKLQLPTFSSRPKDVLLGSLTTANKSGDASCTDFTKRVNKTSNNLETGPDRSTSRQRVPRWIATRLTRLTTKVDEPLGPANSYDRLWKRQETRLCEEKGLGTTRTKTGRGEDRQRGREEERKGPPTRSRHQSHRSSPCFPRRQQLN